MPISEHRGSNYDGKVVQTLIEKAILPTARCGYLPSRCGVFDSEHLQTMHNNENTPHLSIVS